jgi:hypothetical protein
MGQPGLIFTATRMKLILALFVFLLIAVDKKLAPVTARFSRFHSDKEHLIRYTGVCISLARRNGARIAG